MAPPVVVPDGHATHASAFVDVVVEYVSTGHSTHSSGVVGCSACPAGHTTSGVQSAPLLAWWYPYGQAHACDPGSEVWVAAHARQAAMPELLTPALYVPLGQAVQVPLSE